MAQESNNKPSPFKRRFRLVIMSDISFEEVWSFRLTVGNVVYGFLLLIVILVIAGGLLMTFTPLRHWIPDYPDARIRRGIIDNSIRVDSLTAMINTQDQYITNLKHILSGNISTELPSPNNSSDNRYDLLDSLNQREFDSIIRKKVEFDRQLSVSATQTSNKSSSISMLQFFPPVRGVVSNVFNAKAQHYGIDIVTRPKSPVCATLSGTVIYKGWTLEGGNVIQLQHADNIVTVYKHNATILKNQGDWVSVGEPVGIVGNTGEYSTGPHLHFEIWHNGVPIDPANYVSFN